MSSSALVALRGAFVESLVRNAGRPLDEDWVSAFREVPRDVFVPWFFTPYTDRAGWRLVERPHAEWLHRVWSNEPLITQLNGDDTLVGRARRGEPVEGVSTSSSSTPSLMALMLQALTVREGHRVLEIGTGTGYNAAVLCHRLRSDNVLSMDVDSAVVDRARSALAGLGYEPVLEAADGLDGHAAAAPYDRIIATVAIPKVPTRWLEQTKPGGRILFPLDRRNCAGIMPLLTVHGGTAQGRFLPDYGGFMSVDRERRDAAQAAFCQVGDTDGTERVTETPHTVITDPAHPAAFFLALMTGGVDSMQFVPDDGGTVQTWIGQDNGSWVCHTTEPGGRHTVRQSGPRNLWNAIESALDEWVSLGRPARERFGMTISPEEHTIWLDNSHSTFSRPLSPVG